MWAAVAEGSGRGPITGGPIVRLYNVEHNLLVCLAPMIVVAAGAAAIGIREVLRLSDESLAAPRGVLAREAERASGRPVSRTDDTR